MARPRQEQAQCHGDIRIVLDDKKSAHDHPPVLAGRVGNDSVTVVPTPSVLATLMLPPCNSTMARLTTSPSPVPGMTCRPTAAVTFEPRKNALNSRGRSAAGMPTPESATATLQPSPSAPGQALTVTRPPLGVNLTALLTRLSTTWCSRVSSQMISGPSAHSSTR